MHPVVDPLILLFFFLLIVAILVYERPRIEK
jgi:hypothetical protein